MSLWIKIKSCHCPELWYSDKIGKEIEVDETYGMITIGGTAAYANGYFVGNRYIFSQDAEPIAEQQTLPLEA